MNVKNAVKRIVALGTGATMVGATLLGAMAADLGDYPAPFVADGEFDGAIVIGASAATADVLGAIDIAASLQRLSSEEVPVGGSGVTVVGGEDVDVYFGANVVSSTTTYDDQDLDGFLDTTIDFDDEDVDVDEQLLITSGLKIGNSGDSTNFNEEFSDKPYLVVDNSGGAAITYKYVFETDELNATVVDSDEELDITFLGKNLEITNLEDGSMTVSASASKFMTEGDSIEIDGHTVTLSRVGESSARVTVDGQTLTVQNGDSEEFDEAGDYTVELESGSIFYIEGATDNSATLKLGDEITDTVEDGDSLELFGEPEDEDDAEWIWGTIEVGTDDYAEYITVEYNQNRENVDVEEDEFAVLGEGESILLPNNYGEIEFAEVKDDDYHTIQIDFDNVKLNGSNPGYTDVIRFDSSDGTEAFNIEGQESETVWVQNVNTTLYYVWYADGTEEVRATANTGFSITLDNDNVNVTPSATDGNWTIAAPGTSTIDTIYLNVQATAGSYDYFGTSEGDADSELHISVGGATAHDFSSEDEYHVLTDYGIVVEEPENSLDSDEVVMQIPEERPQATIVFKGKGTSSSAGSSTSTQLNKIAVGMAVLDTDARLGTDNYIVVGGPCVNSIAFELMGLTAGDECAADFEEGKAKIKLYDDQNALLVAGYSATDTQGASRVLAEYDNEDYADGFAEGVDEFEVVIPTLTSISIRTI